MLNPDTGILIFAVCWVCRPAERPLLRAGPANRVAAPAARAR